jgi:phosphoglycolate phosphatase-like HAD superfamily hydrolase
MFDVDGTLVESYNVDSSCFQSAVSEVTGIEIDTDWSTYQHVTDAGILNEILELNKIPQTELVHQKVKAAFVRNIQEAIRRMPLKEVPGAASVLNHLRAMEGVVVSIATGGWYESAIEKLSSAQVDYKGLPFASCNDSFSRKEILKIAAKRAGANGDSSITYFGDGAWDQETCSVLGYRFILVGSRIESERQILNFGSIDEVVDVAGLRE